MRALSLVLGLVLMGGVRLATAAPQTPVASVKPDLACTVGPLTKTYGGVPWLVYSCSDQHSLVFLSAAGSPAMPFYFMAYFTPQGYRLMGEGEGDKVTTDAAYAELKPMTDTQFTSLVHATQQKISSARSAPVAAPTYPAGVQ